MSEYVRMDGMVSFGLLVKVCLILFCFVFKRMHIVLVRTDICIVCWVYGRCEEDVR